MQINQTKKLAQGSMMIAIFTVLIAIGYYVPVIGLVATIFSPLPIAWYAATYNIKSAVAVAMIGTVVTFFFGGLLIVPFALIFAAVGVAIGNALRIKATKLYLFLTTSITLLLTFALQYIISLKLFEFDIIQDTLTLMRKSYEQSLAFSEELTGQAAMPAEELQKLFDMIELAIPSTITISIFMLTFILISLNLPVLKRIGIDVPKFGSFKNMRLPKSILWYYFIVLFIDLFLRPEVGTTMHLIILNFSMVLWMLLVLQGMSLIFYILDAYAMPRFLKVVSVFFAIPLFSFIVLVGILDLGFNIRGFIDSKIQK